MGYSPWGQKDSDMTEWLSTVQEQSERLNYNNLTRLPRKKRGLRKHTRSRLPHLCLNVALRFRYVIVIQKLGENSFSLWLLA